MNHLFTALLLLTAPGCPHEDPNCITPTQLVEIQFPGCTLEPDTPQAILDHFSRYDKPVPEMYCVDPAEDDSPPPPEIQEELELEQPPAYEPEPEPEPYVEPEPEEYPIPYVTRRNGNFLLELPNFRLEFNFRRRR